MVWARLSDKGNDVAIGISHKKISSTPWVFGESLSKIDSALFKLLKQTLYIRDFHGSQDQATLAGGRLCEEGLMHETDVQANGITRYRTIKWRQAVEEVDCKTQLLLEETGTSFDIPYKQDRGSALQER